MTFLDAFYLLTPTLHGHFLLFNVKFSLNYLIDQIGNIENYILCLFMTCAVSKTSRSLIDRVVYDFKNDVFNFKAVNGDGNEKICHFQHFLSRNWKERIHNIKLEQTMLGVPRIFPFLKHLIDMSLPGRHYGARFF